MLHLITGLPGAGKSLRMMSLAKKALDESRPVYVHGIDDISLPNIVQLDDPTKWQDAPDGALFVFDEIQKAWPTRRTAEPPEYIRALSEHRHRGFDFIIGTQHPTMIDAYVRKLVGKHEHLLRKFGMQASTVFHWSEVQDDPQKDGARNMAEESIWAFPKDMYQFYKSATLHTVKRRIPKALLFIIAAALALPVLGYFVYTSVGNITASTDHNALPDSGLPERAAPMSDKTKLRVEYQQKFEPRIADVPWSAPAYDEFQVKDYPRPYCVISGDSTDKENSKCTCYTQQATRLSIGDFACRNYVNNGVFDPYKEPHQSSQQGGGVVQGGVTGSGIQKGSVSGGEMAQGRPGWEPIHGQHIPINAQDRFPTLTNLGGG